MSRSARTDSLQRSIERAMFGFPDDEGPAADDVVAECVRASSPIMTPVQAAIVGVTTEITDLLISKNRAYGNSAIDPVRIFSKADRLEQLDVRIDDKLSRIARGDGSGDEDPELDLIGYLVLKRVARGLAA